MEPSTERAARAEQNLKDRYTFGVAAHRLSCKQYALVAQSAEHRTFNARVRSSSLRRRTTPPGPIVKRLRRRPFTAAARFKSRSGHQYVQVAELADAPGSNPGSLCGIVGSIPTLDTMRRHMARFYVARSSVG